MAYLIRVQLPDRPGSLGALAIALGSIGADIESFEVIERGEGYAIDDLVINLNSGGMPDNIITAAEKLDNVIVDSIRPHTGSFDFLHELELIGIISSTQSQGWELLISHAPQVLKVNWVSILGRQYDPESGKNQIEQLYASVGAPQTLPEIIEPWPETLAITYDENSPWIPAMWSELDTALAAAPMPGHSCILFIGRTGGPEFRAPEILRLGYLTGILSSILPKLEN